MFKAADHDGDGAGAGALAQGFFPFFFVVLGAGAEEGGLVGGNGVVEVGLEGGGGGLGVPLGEGDVDLFLDLSGTCGGG